MNAILSQSSQLAALCEHLTDLAICFIDENGIIADWNAGAARLYQLPESAAIGYKAGILFDAAPLAQGLHIALWDGGYESEWHLCSSRTNDRSVSVNIRPVHDGGRLAGYTLMAQSSFYEKKMGEQFLQEVAPSSGNGLFEQLVEHSYSGISLFNAAFRMIYRSPSAVRITGFQDNERVDASVNDMIHPADRMRIKSLLEELIQLPGASRTCQFRSRHADGHFMHLECVFTNWLHEPGIRAVVLNFRDISDAKSSEEHLKQMVQELSAYKYALDEAAIVAVTDQQGRITHVNDYFCRISGYNREELLGCDHRILNSGYHNKSYIRNLWRTIASGQIWRGELCNKSKDGRTYWVATTIVPFLNEYRKPYQYMAIRFDITSAKEADAELHRKSEQISSLLEGVSDGFCALDEELCYTYVNPTICRMVGMEAGEMLGRYIWDLFPEAVGSATYLAIEKARQERVSVVVEEDYYAPLDLWQESRIYPVTNGLSVFVTDISVRKRNEREAVLLADLSRIFDKQEKLTPSLVQAARHMLQFSGAGLTEIWMNSSEQGQLYLSATAAANDIIREAFVPDNVPQMTVGKGLAGLVSQHGTILSWRELAGHPDFVRKNAAERSGLTYGLGIPLRSGGEMLGAMVLLFGTDGQETFSEEFALKCGEHLGAEITRKQLKRELHQIFESVPDIICTVGDDRRFKRVNQAMCDLLGYSESELTGKSIDELIYSEDINASKERTRFFREAGLRTIYFENRYVAKSGKIIHLAWSVRKSIGKRSTLLCSERYYGKERTGGTAAKSQRARAYRQLGIASADGIGILVATYERTAGGRYGLPDGLGKGRPVLPSSGVGVY
ncbi:MAG: PAS domain S-box protein [Chitinophagaceae bacterium]